MQLPGLAWPGLRSWPDLACVPGPAWIGQLRCPLAWLPQVPLGDRAVFFRISEILPEEKVIR